ncbi:hypothetical protein C8R47DRAFT_406527 [Mycena vitilis]|nr:hypothetical protein C8R47DRAFT_406527 [Mycena vitilis]
MANPFQPPSTMIPPSASFYDPDQPQQQWDYQPQFDFTYPAPGVSYDELIAQYLPHQQQTQHHQNQQHMQQHAQYAPYIPVQSTSNPTPNTTNTTAPNRTPDPPQSSAPKRKRVAKKAAPAPQPSAYSDNSDSDDGYGGFNGSAGISVGMGGLGVRSNGARLPGACTHCKKLKMKCDFGPGGSGSPGGSDGADNTCRRCRAGGHVCIVEGRKPRSAPKSCVRRSCPGVCSPA